MKSFGDRLLDAVEKRNSAVCVGLDPRWKNLPDSLKSGVDPADLAAVSKATERFCSEVIDAVADVAPIIKPQAAFFEQLGPCGMSALAAAVRHATRAGMLVLMDGKRGDIGSTAHGYADAYLGEQSAWGCNALTVNPYLGDDTLEPFVTTANSRGAGIFVLVKTSNPGSGFLQDQRIVSETDTATVYEKMADLVQSFAINSKGSSGYGNIGAVVGATYPQQLAELRQRMPNAWLLIPGFGAQGGTASDVAHGFDSKGTGAIVNSSRGIIFAYEKPQYASLSWQDAIAAATRDMTSQLREATSRPD